MSPSTRVEKNLLTLILLLAAVLRFWRLGEVPPGLCHDEVANWLIARDILAGRHAIYFTAAYGHEPLYHYVQAATVALFGDHWLGLRYPSVAFGLLGLAVTYALMRRLFGPLVALPTAVYLAVGFWPLFYSRIGLRAISLPFFAALGVYWWERGSGKAARMVGAGVFFGLAFYTYMAARALPLIAIAYLGYRLLVAPRSVMSRWRDILRPLLVAALIAAPLFIYLGSHPGVESRVAEVREPLDRLLSGDPGPVWQNLIANLCFFTVSGDPWPRQNIPGRPVFADPISAALFYLGVLITLLRLRDPRYGFLLIWLLGSLAPSVATTTAPNSIRDILGLVVVYTFPALSLATIATRLSSLLAAPSPTAPSSIAPSSTAPSPTAPLFIAPLLIVPLLTASPAYFQTWPRHPTVRFDYQSDLTAVAHRLDTLPADVPVAVGGLSVHTMDGPGLELAAHRDVSAVRLCDTRETVLFPGGGTTAAYLFIPHVVPLDDDLRALLLRLGAAAEDEDAFATYRLPVGAAPVPPETEVLLPDGTPAPLPTTFGDTLAFLGYEYLPAPEGSLALLTYWRVLSPPTAALKIFVHLTDASGSIRAQHDGLGSPPRGWAPGDLIIQKHVLTLPDEGLSGLYTLQIGLYNAPAGPRLPVAGDDHLILLGDPPTDGVQ